MKIRFNRIAAFVLAFMMMVPCSVQNVFASSVNSVAYEDAESWGAILIEDENSGAVSTNSVTVASGEVAANSLARVSIGRLSAGSSKTITITWSSKSLPIYVGVYKSGSSGMVLTRVTGGSATITLKANTAGTYYVYFRNPNTSAVTVKCTCY